jgi:hemoglobin
MKASRFFPFLFIAAVALAAACGPTGDSANSSAAGADTSLYRRLGGYDAIAAVTDSFLAKVAADTALNIFFAGLEPAQMNRVRQLVVDQLCAAAGGPCLYTGRSMRESHATLDITTETFDRFVRHIETTLVDFSVGDREQREVLGVLVSMRPDIVTR